MLPYAICDIKHFIIVIILLISVYALVLTFEHQLCARITFFIQVCFVVASKHVWNLANGKKLLGPYLIEERL